MHLILLLTSLLGVVLISMLTLRSRWRARSWSHRRILQGVVLAMPLLSLGISSCDLHYALGHACFAVTSSFWDDPVGNILALTPLAMALGALLWGSIRLLLMHWVLPRTGGRLDDDLQALVVTCARRLDMLPPAVRLCVAAYPLAWTSGWRQPWLVLSTWMKEHLDRQELEAVIMHELAHVARQDTRVLWIGRVLRDAFWYLPTSRVAYRQLEQDKEPACDDLAVGVTHRPLALASALTKVWLQAVDGSATPSFEFAHHLEGTHPQIVERIERLMVKRASSPATVSAPSGLSILSALGAIEVTILLLLFGIMACGPLLILARWF